MIHPLQSTEWGEFRREWGNRVQRFSFGQITIHKIPYTPFSVAVFSKGPVLTQDQITELKDFAKKNKIIFIKLEPLIKKSEGQKFVKLLQKNGAVQGKALFTPETFEIDLTKSEEELLTSFHPKTRYNIRLAQKKGVVVTEDNRDKAFNLYLKLTMETSKRQGFYAHNERYHRLMWKHLNTNLVQEKKAPIARLLVAKYKGKTLVTWIVFVYDKVLYYPYGASTRDYREVMAPNLMMWEAIRYGKANGCVAFDLWGKEEGKGFTKFKEGYNPQVVSFIGTWDLICSKVYYLYKIVDRLRWKILKLKALIVRWAR